MKVLSIEEKAQRFDEALKVARSNYETIVQMDNDCTFAKEGIVNTFHHMFPELAESEDEKIRKWLIHYFKEVCDNVSEKEKKGIVAWLEKRPKDSPVHSNSTNIGKVEQKPAEWNTNDEQMLNSTIKDLIHPCYEEIPDRIEEEIKWIKSMRNRVVSQPKQEWSEENEKMFEHIIAKATLHFSSINYLDEEEINFLKSLRHQPHWKPSDGQMKAVKEAACYSSVFSEKTIDNLISLSKDLKKLKG